MSYTCFKTGLEADEKGRADLSQVTVFRKVHLHWPNLGAGNPVFGAQIRVLCGGATGK